MMPTTEKVRLHRLRQKRGEVVLPAITVSQNVIDLLIREQFLSEWDCCDKAIVRAAAERYLEVRSTYQ